MRPVRTWWFLFALWFLPGVLGRAYAQPQVPAAERYQPAAAALEALLTREIADKQIPSIAIALVEDQQIVWARGFGLAKTRDRIPATAETVYRVGSVSKLFTDLAVMQLVERGQLDLDAPLTKYIPDFNPKNPYGKPVTLRQLLSHRAGLVREPPVGNYFDPTEPSLADSVRSLNNTELLLEPESKTKYSNAGIGVVGYVVERTQKEPFPEYLQRSLLVPLGMKKSSFLPTPAIKQDLADAIMWTYHGRTFPAPTFELGVAPAGCMYSTVSDLGRFLSFLFARGQGSGGPLLKPETLEAMWTPQFAKPGEKTGFGIGFMLSELDGKRRIGHGGAIYGFSTALAALPDEKLGVVVIASKDVTNPVTDNLADLALRMMLAARAGQPLPKVETSTAIPSERLAQLVGRYTSMRGSFDLVDEGSRLYFWPARGGFRQEIRQRGELLVADDALGQSLTLEPAAQGLKVGDTVYQRSNLPRPEPPPARWLGLIGEYGWDHNVLYILEKDGKLHALIEWFFLYPLEEVSPNVFKFPDFGLYHDEKLVFERDGKMRGTQVTAAGVVFKRRAIDGENGATFKIQPRRPVSDLRKEALQATPPRETGFLEKPDLVDLTKVEPGIKLDVRYATTNNFLSTQVYNVPAAYLQRPAAEALGRVHRALAAEGYGLMVHDGYRPWFVTKIFWDATEDRFHNFVADPSRGSRHNRGAAVDLTLYELATGKTVAMVGGYDEMSDRSFPGYPGGTSLQRWHRDLLRRAMEREGFTVYEAEWWHFDHRDWKKYPILNITFQELGQ